MRYILLLINLFILSFCINDTYLALCDDGAPLSNVSTVRQCQLYTPVNSSNGFCCRLYYTSTYKSGSTSTYTTTYYGYYYYVYYKKNSTNLRKLDELIDGSCIGISPEGYDNIKEVIKELEEESPKSGKELQIDCSFKYLKIYNIYLFLILIILL